MIDNIDNLMVNEAIVLKALRNIIMKNGNKQAANKVVDNILMLLRSTGITRPIALICRSIDILKPVIETRPIKRGGQVRQVPTLIKTSRQYILAIQWLVIVSKRRVKSKDSGSNGIHGLAVAIAQELRAIGLDSILPRRRMLYSESMAKRNNMHKNANMHRVNIYMNK
jgi:ribosomal protein S7